MSGQGGTLKEQEADCERGAEQPDRQIQGAQWQLPGEHWHQRAADDARQHRAHTAEKAHQGRRRMEVLAPPAQYVRQGK